MSLPSPTLDSLRGDLPPARANARSVAALTGNPGCSRRRVLDAARVPSHELASRLGFPAQRGQSPFAIATGNQFEFRLKKGSRYALLIEALQPLVSLPPTPTVLDLGGGRPARNWESWLRKRAEQTRDALRAIARGDVDAPHIVDHPVLEFDLGGSSVFLEPDGLAFRVGSKLDVEIKSYPVIDGQADPSKLAATGSQSAVYILALRAELSRLGFDPELLCASVILVAPRNFGRTPVTHRLPLQKKVAALQRVLRGLPRAATLIEAAGLPPETTFGLDPAKGGTGARKQLETTVRALPMLYRPECMASCDMAKFCRHQAETDDDPARLGRAHRDALAGVHRLSDALRLATSGPGKGERELADVAEALGRAHAALSRARAVIQPSGGVR